LQADYVTMVENRHLMFAQYRLPVTFFHFWPKQTHPAARSLCDSWDSCYYGCSMQYAPCSFATLMYYIL